jgi:hypothetical protein
MYRKRYFGLDSRPGSGSAVQRWETIGQKKPTEGGFLCEVFRRLGGSRGSLGDELEIGPMGLIKLTEHDSPLLCGCDRLGWI